MSRPYWKPRQADRRIMFDVSELTGDSTPVSLWTFLADNQEAPPDEDEVEALRSVEVGEEVALQIGGGGVWVTRVELGD